MTSKILIVVICAAIGTVVGVVVSNIYKRNLDYLDGVCGLIGELKRNMAHRRDAASSVLARYVASGQLKKNIDEYLKYVGDKNGTLDISRGFLPTRIYGSVRDLFSSLGAADDGALQRELDAFSKTFNELRGAAAARSDKYGALAVKLGFLFGLGVGILTL